MVFVVCSSDIVRKEITSSGKLKREVDNEVMVNLRSLEGMRSWQSQGEGKGLK